MRGLVSLNLQIHSKRDFTRPHSSSFFNFVETHWHVPYIVCHVHVLHSHVIITSKSIKLVDLPLNWLVQSKSTSHLVSDCLSSPPCFESRLLNVTFPNRGGINEPDNTVTVAKPVYCECDCYCSAQRL